jgi:phage shock protein C
MNVKRLYRSTRDRRIAGVAGGIAEYFAVDVTLIRLIWVLAVLFGGTGVLAYIIAWIVIPEEIEIRSEPAPVEAAEAAETAEPEPAKPKTGGDGWPKGSLFGLVLILLGLFFLVKALIPWDLGRYFWPFFLIALGVILLVPFRRKS